MDSNRRPLSVLLVEDNPADDEQAQPPRYPATETAIESVQLPVLAYLVKPFKFEDLLAHVRFGVERSKAYHAVQRLRQHVQEWEYELEGSGRVLSQATSQAFSDPLGVFLQASFLRTILILSELIALPDPVLTQAEA